MTEGPDAGSDIAGEPTRATPTHGGQRRTGTNEGASIPRRVPMHGTDDPMTLRNTSGIGEFPKTVSDADVEYVATRVLVANRTLFKLANDSFDKWFRVESENEELSRAIEKYNKTLDMKKAMKAGFIFNHVGGYSLIALGWKEAGIVDTEKEPEKATDICYLCPVSKSMVKKIEYDNDPGSATYGSVKMYTLTRPKGSTTEDVKFHPARFLHWERPNIYNTREGESFFHALYNIYLAYENMTYAIPEALWQLISPLRQVELPDWVSDLTLDAQDEAFEDAQEYFKNLSVKDTWVTWPGYKFNVHSTDKGMKIEGAADFIENQMSAGGISRYLLQGFPAGTIAGSEVNRDEYIGDIENLQTSFIEDAIREIYERMQALKILPEGDFNIIWEPLKKLTDKEIEEIKGLASIAALRYATAAKAYKDAGFAVAFVEGEIVVTDEAGGEIVVTGEDKREPKHEHKHGADAYYTPQEYQRLSRLSVSDAPYHREFYNKNRVAFIKAEKEYREEFKRIFDKQAPKGLDKKRKARDNEADILNALTEWEYQFDEFGNLMEKEYIRIYTGSGEESAGILNDRLGISTTFKADDPQARKWLKAQANLQFNKTTREIDGKIKQGLSQILEKGLRVTTRAELSELYKVLDDSIVKAFERYDGNLKTMTRTETQRIVGEASLDSYQQAGIEMVQILVDPSACSECQQYAGQIMPLEEAQGLIPIHPNCTCGYLPIIPEAEEPLELVAEGLI